MRPVPLAWLLGSALVALLAFLSACPQPAPGCTQENCAGVCQGDLCGFPSGSSSSASSPAGRTSSSLGGASSVPASSAGPAPSSSAAAPSSSFAASAAQQGSSTAGGPSSATIAPSSAPSSSAAGASSASVDGAVSSSAAPLASSGPVPTQSRLGVVVRTGTASTAGTDDPARFCLGARCFSLNIANEDDREPRSADVHVFNVPYTPRASVPLVALETTTGGDAWRPVCLQVVLDGEPLYCRGFTDLVIGNTGTEVMRFEDTQLAVDCNTCIHGALVGATTPTSTQLWFRSPGERPVQVEYSTQPDLGASARSVTASAQTSSDSTVHIPITGLQPDTRYFYRLWVDGVPLQAAPFPSFRTAPPPGPAEFTVAFGSCADDRDTGQAWSEMPIYNHVASLEPSLMLMLGDNHYANSNEIADRSLWLADLRSHYRNTRNYPSFMSLVSRTPTYAIWDDHDFVGNNTIGSAYPTDRAVALRAFKEFWANPGYGTGGEAGTWHSFVWGDVEFFMLDGRYWRAAPGGTMLGAAQLAWLTTGLIASNASFKVVASGSIWHTGPTDDDSWGEHNAERETIIRTIFDHQVGGVLFLGGDIHRAGDWRIPTAVTGGYPLYEFVSSGLAQGTSACGAPSANEERYACEGGSQYFGVLRFVTTGPAPTVTHEIRDATNAVRHTRTIRLDALQVP